MRERWFVPSLERLEERWNPVQVVVRNGSLIATGSCYPDTIQVKEEDGLIKVNVNRYSANFPKEWIDKIYIRAGNGYDIVVVDESVNIPCDIRVNCGNDFVQGGSGDDVIWGGVGADTLLGGEGDDTIFGHYGPDVLKGGPGQDWLDGGYNHTVRHRDTIFANAEDMIVGERNPWYPDVIEDDDSTGGTISRSHLNLKWIDVDGQPIFSGSTIEVVYVSGVVATYTDVNTLTITGTPNDDWIDVSGFSGRAVINGGAGNDYIVGGDGNDSINGGSGNDWIDGGYGNDTLIGGSGNDTLTGGPGWDRIDLRDGVSNNDRILDPESGDVILRDPSTLVMAAYDGEPDDYTGLALYRGETVEFREIFFPGVSGIFYQVFLNGRLEPEDPEDRRANGMITVQVPVMANFIISPELKNKLMVANNGNSWLTIQVIQRNESNSQPSDPTYG